MADESEDITGNEIDEPYTNKDVMSVNLVIDTLVKGKKITKIEKKSKAETMAGKKKELNFSVVHVVEFVFDIDYDEVDQIGIQNLQWMIL
jgi:hypothetical protein